MLDYFFITHHLIFESKDIALFTKVYMCKYALVHTILQLLMIIQYWFHSTEQHLCLTLVFTKDENTFMLKTRFNYYCMV